MRTTPRPERKRHLASFQQLDGGTVTGNAVIDDAGRLYYGYHEYN